MIWRIEFQPIGALFLIFVAAWVHAGHAFDPITALFTGLVGANVLVIRKRDDQP